MAIRVPRRRELAELEAAGLQKEESLLQSPSQLPASPGSCLVVTSALCSTPGPPTPSSAPGTWGHKGMTVTSILHSAPNQGTLQTPEYPFISYRKKKKTSVWLKLSTACVRHSVCTLEEFRGHLPTRRDAPCCPPSRQPPQEVASGENLLSRVGPLPLGGRPAGVRLAGLAPRPLLLPVNY